MNLKTCAKFMLMCLCVFLCVSCAKKDEKIVLKFSSWGSESEVSIIKPLIKDFEDKNPDIKIEFVHIPQNYFQKLHLLFASNLSPDVIFVNNINAVVYADAGLFENLKPYIESDDFDKNDFFPPSFEALSYNGIIYAVPRDISNLVIFYNKDIFDKCKIPYPSSNWDSQEFLNKAIAIKKCSGKWAFGFDKKSVFWLPFLWSNGGGLLSKDGKTVLLDRPESIEGIRFYSDLKNKYHLSPNDAQQGSLSNSQLFSHQEIAMQLSGHWSVPFFSENLKFNWGVAPFPRFKKGSIVDADASGWAISRSSLHKKQAWRFIKFMSSKDSIEKMTQSGLIIPSRISVAYSEVFLKTSGLEEDSSKVFIDAIKTGMATPANKNYQEILDLTHKRLELLFNGKKDASEVFDKNFAQEAAKLSD